MREAGHIINNGGVVVFPTRSVYGLAADAYHAAAVNRIFTIKKRPKSKALLVLIDGRQDLDRLVSRIPLTAQGIMTNFWPGKVTIVFEALPTLPQELTAGTGRIGVRLPGHPVAAALVREAGGPITGTSANTSGNPAVSSIAELDADVVKMADLILDAGKLLGGTGSTVIDVSIDPPEILREGALSARELSESTFR